MNWWFAALQLIGVEVAATVLAADKHAKSLPPRQVPNNAQMRLRRVGFLEPLDISDCARCQADG